MRPDGSDFFVLEVSDTGIGIKPEDTKRLFVEFQQLDGGASKKYQGTGLGLALTRRIVEAQGGVVGLRSVLGEGSTFFARLPRVQEGATSSISNSVRPQQDFDSTRHSVLVIEDHGDDRSWIAATLEHAGYMVDSAATGAAAIGLLESRRFDAITLDLLLPDMSGWDILRQIRENSVTRDVPVVIVTILADEGVGVGFSINGFLEKPIDHEVLLNTLTRAGVVPTGMPAVLLVDDDKADLELYETALRECGFTTNAHSSASEALRAASNGLPDVLVLDLVMPDIDGFEFMRRFREIDGAKTVPVIVLTAKDISRKELEVLTATARMVVHKGSGSVQALLAEVKAALSARNSVAQVERVLGASNAAKSSGEANQKVLVIEDNDGDRQWLMETLARSGYVVSTASNGKAAIEQLKQHTFAAVTLDLILPDMNGWDLLKEMRSEGINRTTPVLITTVVADKSAATAPVDDYLLKPIDPSRLLASLAAVGVSPHIGKKILILDDELGTARLIESALREWGYEPIFTDNGTTALDLIRREQFSAMVVDLVMPEMGGYEFLDRLRNEGIGLPAIVMTAADVTHDELKRIKSVAQMIVHKGVDGTIELLEALHECTHSDTRRPDQ
jgi:CheY-like chemotaxis protein